MGERLRGVKSRLEEVIRSINDDIAKVNEELDGVSRRLEGVRDRVRESMTLNILPSTVAAIASGVIAYLVLEPLAPGSMAPLILSVVYAVIVYTVTISLSKDLLRGGVDGLGYILLGTAYILVMTVSILVFLAYSIQGRGFVEVFRGLSGAPARIFLLVSLTLVSVLMARILTGRVEEARKCLEGWRSGCLELLASLGVPRESVEELERLSMEKDRLEGERRSLSVVKRYAELLLKAVEGGVRGRQELSEAAELLDGLDGGVLSRYPYIDPERVGGRETVKRLLEELSRSRSGLKGPQYNLGDTVYTDLARAVTTWIESAAKLTVPGLIDGYGCTPDSRVSLPSPIAPKDFEGEWRCCMLGCGGWGCVYRCRLGDREFAVKVPRGYEDLVKGTYITVQEDVIKRIMDEARILAGINHPNVLRLLGYSTSAPLLVYEYAEQGSIEWQMSRGWRPGVVEASIIGAQIGDALRYIHGRGLVHGDVKPGNIFLSRNIAKLGDFSGIVRLVSALSQSVIARHYTPGFRAPEQVYRDLRVESRRRGYESRVDVYQLGNTLLYMLTGSVVDGEDADTETVWRATARIRHEGMRRIISSMLAPEPWERPSSEEVARRLLEIALSHTI